MDAFWLSLVIVFMAELGDKTQLVALCLASRFNAKVVLAGIFCATLVVHVVSVLLGGGIGALIPGAWITLAAGIAFVGFGLWTLRGDSLSDEECNAMKGKSPFWLVASTFFLAELGDKTMLSTVTLASEHSIIPVWLGSTMGMVISDGMAILAGQILGKKLPERAVKVGAAAIFFAFGGFRVVEAFAELSTAGCVVGAALLGIVFLTFLRVSPHRHIGPVRGIRSELVDAVGPSDSPEGAVVPGTGTACDLDNAP